ncbi:MFS transporter [Sulfuriferula plumbiphila]|uniref:MFS transporter n=1 Tax=Sulfuriferula plumbiphila TaxID=171865 RepID=A0A512LBJ3_9PROT|nr:MFS transporter [Sulfuriferula plumbiphila]BBP04922.1 MFS transporter [Sulfuriferula plumbiphila]GEP31511.1 MFS transporter [Sulfuriferula plumbiphila]
MKLWPGQLKVLAYRPVRVLWGGLLLSAIGDEFYRIAIVWLGTSLIGTDAGYLSAIQAAATLIFSLTAGIWADAWEHRRTMIGADCLRGLLVLFPVLWVQTIPLSIWMLVPVAILVPSLSAFFDPALQSSIPVLVRDRDLLGATNGLFEATRRMARLIGASSIGLLSSIVPILHFFTIDAVTFFLSAAAVSSLRRDLPPTSAERVHPAARSLRASVAGGFAALRPHALLKYALLTSGVVNGAWQVGFVLGVALELQHQRPGNIGAFGLMIAAYGAGSVLSNMLVGSFRSYRPALPMFAGRIVGGISFVALAFAPNLAVALGLAAMMGVGAPMSNIPLLNLLQTTFSETRIGQVYRIKMVSEWGCILVALLISPFLFRHLSIERVIALCGMVVLSVGVTGLLKFVRLKRRLV